MDNNPKVVFDIIEFFITKISRFKIILFIWDLSKTNAAENMPNQRSIVVSDAAEVCKVRNRPFRCLQVAIKKTLANSVKRPPSNLSPALNLLLSAQLRSCSSNG
jgi:hypothetical protein